MPGLPPARRELAPLIARCNRCGACTAVCPLYAVTKDEGAAARGKLALTEALLEGALPAGPGCAEILNGCLLCGACAGSCASGVPAPDVILAARREFSTARNHPPVLRFFLREVLARPLLTRGAGTFLGVLAFFLRRAGGRSLAAFLAGENPLARRLPACVREAVRVFGCLPVPGGTNSFPGRPAGGPAPGPARKTAGYFTGCAARLFLPGLGRATRHALWAAGISTAAPRNFCCGMPQLAAGDLAAARELAKKNIDLFLSMNPDLVVTDCASCGAMLKGYARLFAGDPGYAEKAAAFAAKVKDFSEALAAAGSPREGAGAAARAGRREKIRVTYHDPCHLARGQGIRVPPRRLLEAVPGVELVEMERPDACCGGGGTFFLTRPDLAAKVGEAKAADILATGADLVVTACPGCLVYLTLALQKKKGRPVPVLHLAELLAGWFSFGSPFPAGR